MHFMMILKVYSSAEKMVEPLADQFKLELMMILTDQDSSVFDALARMLVSAEAFGKFACVHEE